MPDHDKKVTANLNRHFVDASSAEDIVFKLHFGEITRELKNNLQGGLFAMRMFKISNEENAARINLLQEIQQLEKGLSPRDAQQNKSSTKYAMAFEALVKSILSVKATLPKNSLLVKTCDRAIQASKAFWEPIEEKVKNLTSQNVTPK